MWGVVHFLLSLSWPTCLRPPLSEISQSRGGSQGGKLCICFFVTTLLVLMIPLLFEFFGRVMPKFLILMWAPPIDPHFHAFIPQVSLGWGVTYILG
jgi:hypothetical protein